MDLLLDVMNDLQKSHPKIKLVLVGEGAYKKKCGRDCKARQFE